MKRVYLKHHNEPVDIILIKGTYSSVSQIISKHPELFRDQGSNSPHCKIFFNPEAIDRFLAGQYDINRYKTYIFLTGHTYQTSKMMEPIVEKFYDKGFRNVIYTTDTVFETLEIKEIRTRRKCSCDSLDLFRHGCRCGGI